MYHVQSALCVNLEKHLHEGSFDDKRQLCRKPLRDKVKGHLAKTCC